MRLENIEVTFKCKLPINKPDGNGIMYTRDAIIKAYEEAKIGCVIGGEKFELSKTRKRM